MNAPRRRWQRVDGVLLLDKPTGMSSNDALQKARRLFNAEKGGHTGTLDPMASGLLPICFGEATKFGSDLLDADKTYLATLRLGERTDTGDAEGTIVDVRPVTAKAEHIGPVLQRFLGLQMQTPPMYSALKRNGIPLYRLAREGREVEREPREIRIGGLEAVSVDIPELTLRVRCSKGTYVRVLAEDIGEALGCGAHLTALRREQVGSLDIGDARTLEALSAMDQDGRLSALAPVDFLLRDLPLVELEQGLLERFGNGNPVRTELPAGAEFRVYDSGRLIGLGVRDGDDNLQPRRLLRRAAD